MSYVVRLQSVSADGLTGQRFSFRISQETFTSMLNQFSAGTPSGEIKVPTKASGKPHSGKSAGASVPLVGDPNTELALKDGALYLRNVPIRPQGGAWVASKKPFPVERIRPDELSSSTDPLSPFVSSILSKSGIVPSGREKGNRRDGKKGRGGNGAQPLTLQDITALLASGGFVPPAQVANTLQQVQPQHADVQLHSSHGNGVVRVTPPPPPSSQSAFSMLDLGSPVTETLASEEKGNVHHGQKYATGSQLPDAVVALTQRTKVDGMNGAYTLKIGESFLGPSGCITTSPPYGIWYPSGQV